MDVIRRDESRNRLMTDILSTVQILLRQAFYSTQLTAVADRPVLAFEDDSIIGFVTEFESVGELIRDWKNFERTLIEHFGRAFKDAGDKAWNVYTVMLCASNSTSEEAREVSWIAEDLERTRKLAACGVVSRDQVLRVIYPLLPLQHQPNLTTEDISERLLTTLRNVSPRAARVALDDSVAPTEVAKLLGEGA